MGRQASPFPATQPHYLTGGLPWAGTIPDSAPSPSTRASLSFCTASPATGHLPPAKFKLRCKPHGRSGSASSPSSCFLWKPLVTVIPELPLNYSPSGNQALPQISTLPQTVLYLGCARSWSCC